MERIFFSDPCNAFQGNRVLPEDHCRIEKVVQDAGGVFLLAKTNIGDTGIFLVYPGLSIPDVFDEESFLTPNRNSQKEESRYQEKAFFHGGLVAQI